jgi:hypothetical protein
MDYHYCSASFAGAGGGQKPFFSARQRLPSDNTAISTFSLIIEAFYGETVRMAKSLSSVDEIRRSHQLAAFCSPFSASMSEMGMFQQ